MRNVLVIDTETGGLEPDVNAILTVALVTFEGPSIEFKINDPTGAVDAEALLINKINMVEHQQKALTPGVAANRISSWLDVFATGRGGDWVVAGHNVAFDLAFMARLYRLANSPLPRIFRPYKVVDTSTLLWALRTKGLLPEGVKSADAAFAYFNIPVDGRHTALGDAKATATLIAELLKVIR